MSEQRKNIAPLVFLGLVAALGLGYWFGQMTAPKIPTPAPRIESPASPPSPESGTAEASDLTPPETPLLAEESVTGQACQRYADGVCAAAGPNSEPCTQVRSAVALLPPAACDAALAGMDHTLGQIEELRRACRDLEARLCADIGPETEACKLVREQTPNFPPEQCQGMLEHYADVLASLRRMEAQNKPVPADLFARLAAPDAPSFGPAEAAVVVVEFSDFLCPFCHFAAKSIETLKPRYEHQVRFVFRNYPLPMHGQAAELAAQAALAAHAQGKFWVMHDALFSNYTRLNEGRQVIDALAAEVGLDMEAYTAAMDAGTYAEAVRADVALADETVVAGTPALILNGERLDINPRDPAALAQALDAALTHLGQTPPEP